MDPLDAMTDPIGSVPGRDGVSAVVNLHRDDQLVTILLYTQNAGNTPIERDFAPAEARELADLLDEAADLVNQPDPFDDDLHEVGRVTTRDARWVVRAQWPTVGPRLYNLDGSPQLGPEFTPEERAPPRAVPSPGSRQSALTRAATGPGRGPRRDLQAPCSRTVIVSTA